MLYSRGCQGFRRLGSNLCVWCSRPPTATSTFLALYRLHPRLCRAPIWPACPLPASQLPKSCHGPTRLHGDVSLGVSRVSQGGLLVWEAGQMQGVSGGVLRAAQEASGRGALVLAPQGQCPHHSPCSAAFGFSHEGHLCPLPTAAAGGRTRQRREASGAPAPPLGSGPAGGLSSSASGVWRGPGFWGQERYNL